MVTNNNFCESSTDNVPLLVCAGQSAFLMPFDIALQMHNFVLDPFNVAQNIINAHLQTGRM